MGMGRKRHRVKERKRGVRKGMFKILTKDGGYEMGMKLESNLLLFVF